MSECPTAEEIEGLAPWHYQVTFPNGYITQGGIVTDTSGYFEASGKFAGYDLAGKSVFEVGPASGHMTRLMLERGATVTAIDVDPDNVRRTQMYLAAWGLHADLLCASIEEIGPGFRTDDLVTFTGVLYHLQSPQRGLLRAWSCAGEAMLVQSHLYSGSVQEVMAYLPGYRGDHSNWWFPTRNCLRHMLHDLPGASRIDFVPGASCEESAVYWVYRSDPQ